MKHCALRVAAGAVALLFWSSAAPAAPVRCADQQNECTAACAKRARKPVSACVSDCQARQVACQQNGCWTDGAGTYCGLLRR